MFVSRVHAPRRRSSHMSLKRQIMPLSRNSEKWTHLQISYTGAGTMWACSITTCTCKSRRRCR